MVGASSVTLVLLGVIYCPDYLPEAEFYPACGLSIWLVRASVGAIRAG